MVCLGLSPLTARILCSIPGWGTNILWSHMLWPKQNMLWSSKLHQQDKYTTQLFAHVAGHRATYDLFTRMKWIQMVPPPIQWSSLNSWNKALKGYRNEQVIPREHVKSKHIFFEWTTSFIYSFGQAAWLVGSQFPDQRFNPDHCSESPES